MKVLLIGLVLFISLGCVELETDVKSHVVSAGHKKQLKDVKSWLYQLQGLNLRRVSETDFDLIVMDYAKDGDAETEYKNGQIKNFKNLTEKIVLAYMI